jgi:2-methylcitrate dehydratase PrpD
MSLSRSIAAWAAGVRWADIPTDVQQHAIDDMRDCLSVMFGGSLTTSAQIAAKFARSSPGTVPLVAGGTAALPSAAFANGVAAAALDFEDGHYLGGAIHPASVVGAAALAAAPPDATVGDLLTAQVVGFEVGLRAAGLLWAKHPGDWYHCTGCAGALGAAAAAAHVRGLDPDAMYRAIVIAWQHAPMSSFAAPMIKESIGWGAQVGAAAAQLAEFGYMKLPEGYDPPMPDVMPTTPFDRPGVENDDYVMSYGRVWEAGNTYFKQFAACRYTHAAAAGLRELVAEHSLTAANISSIEVGTLAGAVFLAEQHPKTLEHMQYSFPQVLAAIVIDGRAGPAEISEGRIGDRERAVLASKVTVVHSAAMDTEYPAHYGSHLRVTTTDGRVHQGAFLDAPGDRARPLTKTDLQDKWRSTLAPVVPDSVAEGLLSGVGELERSLCDVVGPAFDAVSVARLTIP